MVDYKETFLIKLLSLVKEHIAERFWIFKEKLFFDFLKTHKFAFKNGFIEKCEGAV